MKSKTLLMLIFGLLLLGIVFYFSKDYFSPKDDSEFVSETALLIDWYDFALKCERYSDGYSAPVSARTFSYLSLAVFEMHRPKFDFDNIQKKLFPKYPLYAGTPVPNEYCAEVALNEGLYYLFQQFYGTMPKHVKDELKAKKDQWNKHYLNNLDIPTFNSSIQYGLSAAKHIYEWSSTDSISHLAHFYYFDKDYPLSDKLGSWRPTKNFPMPPLLPHWGKSRTSLIDVDSIIARPLPAFSLEKGSFFYNQAIEVYTISSPLSKENRWIAEFWSDDHNRITFTPTGRWISILSQIVKNEKLGLEETIIAYLKLSLALNDGLIVCWNSKYHYNLMRPETYINLTFDPQWVSHFHTPPFPSYPSGHSVISGVAEVVLEHLFGKNYPLKDVSHQFRNEFIGTPRSFESINEMAEENAISRVLLGVHFRVDCEEGLRMGREIGSHFLIHH